MNTLSKEFSRPFARRIFSGLFCLVTLAWLVFVASEGSAQDWPQWRGPNRDGVIASLTGPKSWPERMKTVWKVEVGIGHSSPILAGKRIYLFSRQQENEVMSCLDLETGKEVWRDSYPASYTMNPAAVSHGKGPKSTPIFHDSKIYTLGISGILTCYDAASGRVRWRKEFSKQFKATSPFFGSATSPLFYNGTVVVHVGGNDSGALTAFDADTGEVRWSWTGDGPGYASPILFESGGLMQIVTQTQKSVAGFSASSGELLWRIPFETEYVQNIITPVAYKDLIIYSGIDKGTAAVRLQNRSGKWETEQVWFNQDVSMYMSSPVISGDYLYGLSHKRKGQLFCIDARSGKTAWTSNGREGDNAAIVTGGQLVFVLNDGAELTVLKTDPKQMSILKKYSVADSSTWAHPVIVGNRLLIKDTSHLALLSLD
jgi:outer membrane protein assembly factor BamB